MTRHDAFHDDPVGWASLHALGALPPREQAEYEAHRAACAACGAEAGSMARTAAELSALAPEAEPPAGLRDRVLARARAERPGADPPPAQVWKRWGSESGESGGFALLRDEEGAWEPTRFAGVEARRLFVDAANDRVTMLVRMAAGSRYPGHVHAGPEDCYVVRGDLRSGDFRMCAGDFKRAAAGSVDGIQSTEGGCLLLIVSSLRDELVEPSA